MKPYLDPNHMLGIVIDVTKGLPLARFHQNDLKLHNESCMGWVAHIFQVGMHEMPTILDPTSTTVEVMETIEHWEKYHQQIAVQGRERSLKFWKEFELDYRTRLLAKQTEDNTTTYNQLDK